MNYRERFLATIQGESTDFLPYVPRLDLWYKSNKLRGTLPSKYRDASLRDIVDDLEIGYHAVVPDFLDFADPLEDVDRALGIFRLRTLPHRTEFREIRRNITYEGDMIVVEYQTPKGNITTKLVYDEAQKKAGVTLFQAVEHAIKSIDDFEAIAYIFQHAEVQPTYDKYLIGKEEIGDRGVVVGFTSLAASPMHLILRELMSYDQFFFEYFDHPEELKWLAAQIAPYFEQLIDVVADSPAEIVLHGANYDYSLTWPPFFQEYITPYLMAAADKLHSKGKFLLTHTDGENKQLLSEYRAAEIDVADSICPRPMTSLSLGKVREAFDSKITVWGAIPSTSVLENTMSDREFEALLDRTLEEAGNGDHLILSIADTTPPDAKFSRLLKIAKRAREFGPIRV